MLLLQMLMWFGGRSTHIYKRRIGQLPKLFSNGRPGPDACWSEWNKGCDVKNFCLKHIEWKKARGSKVKQMEEEWQRQSVENQFNFENKLLQTSQIHRAYLQNVLVRALHDWLLVWLAHSDRMERPEIEGAEVQKQENNQEEKKGWR